MVYSAEDQCWIQSEEWLYIMQYGEIPNCKRESKEKLLNIRNERKRVCPHYAKKFFFDFSSLAVCLFIVVLRGCTSVTLFFSFFLPITMHFLLPLYHTHSSVVPVPTLGSGFCFLLPSYSDTMFLARSVFSFHT